MGTTRGGRPATPRRSSRARCAATARSTPRRTRVWLASRCEDERRRHGVQGRHDRAGRRRLTQDRCDADFRAPYARDTHARISRLDVQHRSEMMRLAPSSRSVEWRGVDTKSCGAACSARELLDASADAVRRAGVAYAEYCTYMSV